MEFQGAGARGQVEPQPLNDVQEVRVGCECCGALLSVGIPGSHLADTPVIVRCGNCRRLLEVQLTAPAQLPDVYHSANLRQAQALHQERQQQQQQQLRAQGRHMSPFLQSGPHGGSRGASLFSNEGLAQRFQSPGLGRQGHISPSDLTCFAHSQAALQEQMQQGFVPLNRAQPSADFPGNRFSIPPPSGLSTTFLDSLSPHGQGREQLGMHSSQARALSDQAAMLRQRYLQQKGVTDARHQLAASEGARQLLSTQLKRPREGEGEEDAYKAAGRPAVGPNNFFREPARPPSPDQQRDDGTIIRLGQLAKRGEDATREPTLPPALDPFCRPQFGASGGQMIMLEQPGGQGPPHSSFYTRLGEQAAATGGLAQLALLGDRARQPRAEAGLQKEDRRWVLLGAGEKPVEVPRFQSADASLAVLREEVPEEEGPQGNDDAHDGWLRTIQNADEVGAVPQRQQGHDAWINILDKAGPEPQAGSEGAAGQLPEQHPANNANQGHSNLTLQKEPVNGEADQGREFTPPGSPLGSAILQHQIMLDMPDPESALVHESSSQAAGYWKSGPDTQAHGDEGHCPDQAATATGGPQTPREGEREEEGLHRRAQQGLSAVFAAAAAQEAQLCHGNEKGQVQSVLQPGEQDNLAMLQFSASSREQQDLTTFPAIHRSAQMKKLMNSALLQQNLAKVEEKA